MASVDVLLSASDTILRLSNRLEEQQAKIRRLQEAMLSLAENGLGCDLSPTLNYGGDKSAVAAEWQKYLRQQDQNLREFALGILNAD